MSDFTAALLREIIKDAPDDAVIVIESLPFGERFVAKTASVWGTSTEEPFVLIKAVRDRE